MFTLSGRVMYQKFEYAIRIYVSMHNSMEVLCVVSSYGQVYVLFLESYLCLFGILFILQTEKLENSFTDTPLQRSLEK